MTAFQPSAFQNNAFQILVTPTPSGADAFGGRGGGFSTKVAVELIITQKQKAQFESARGQMMASGRINEKQAGKTGYVEIRINRDEIDIQEILGGMML